MLIDRFMPSFDVSERHERRVDGPPDVVFDITRRVDLSRSTITSVLLGIRRIPQVLTRTAVPIPRFSLDSMIDYGFVVLAEKAGEEIVLGAIGTFWKPTGGMRPTVAEEFMTFKEPGFAKATMNVRVDPFGAGSSLVVTETRVLCTDASSRRKFKAYWRLIGPFSALIRLQMLSLVEKEVAASGAR
jgi:hypothetical protein